MEATASPQQTPEEVRDMYASHGVGRRLGFGQRPAVIVVDFQQAYTRTWRAASLAPVEATATLLEAARAAGLPVFYTFMGYDPEHPDAGVWGLKAPTLAENVIGSWNATIDPLITPREGDTVLAKRAASSFFGTGLDEILRGLQVDTVVVVGTSLSGCVRATVVDAISLEYRPMVVRECVADASAPSMAASLQDIDTKYGDVIAVEEAIARFAALGTRSVT
jgi:maleamate amidohydrolase